MKCKVLEPFDYAHDGVRAQRLKAGRSYEIRDALVERFVAEGKIEHNDAGKAATDDATDTPAYGDADSEGAADLSASAEDDAPPTVPVTASGGRRRGGKSGAGRGKARAS